MDIKAFADKLTTEYGVSIECTSEDANLIVVNGADLALQRIKTEVLDKNGFVCDNEVFNNYPDIFGKLMICYYGEGEDVGNGYLVIPADESSANSMKSMLMGMFSVSVVA